MATEPCSMESCPLWTREEEKHKHLLLYSYHLLHGGWILNGKNRTKNTESDHSLNMYLKYLEAVPCFSPFSIPLGCMVGWLQWPMATTYFFFFNQYGRKHSSSTSSKKSAFSRILLYHPYLKWPWSLACFPGRLGGHGKGPAVKAGMCTAVRGRRCSTLE